MLRASALVVVLVVYAEKAAGLQCWKCSSDIDPSCRDPFNERSALSGRSGGLYDDYRDAYQNQNYQRYPQDQRYGDQRSYQDGYQQRQYDASRNYNAARQVSFLETCDENEARLRRMKNVCIKKTIRGSNYVSVIRRCSMITPEEYVGTCYDPVSRGLSLEFCEYCEYDGCNSATGLRNGLLLTLVPVVVGFLFRM